jgi:glutamyl-Q tRNA(Asp) synthetase
VARAGALSWHDRQRGTIAADPLSAGDIVLWRRDGGPAYHLASTVDDADMAIDQVIRGQDLLTATHVHRLLQALLVLPTPDYHHHRLIAGADGRRLAKRDDAASLASMQQAGVAGEVLAQQLKDGELPAPYGWVD